MIQPCCRFLYDREAGQYTVDKYLDDVEQRFPDCLVLTNANTAN